MRPLKHRPDGKQAFRELPVAEESKRAAGFAIDRPFDLVTSSWLAAAHRRDRQRTGADFGLPAPSASHQPVGCPRRERVAGRNGARQRSTANRWL